MASRSSPQRIAAVFLSSKPKYTNKHEQDCCMRVTIFGATGLLGKALMREWTMSERASDEITGLGSRDADIRDPHRVSDAVQRTRPDWIVLAAAYTDVDGCETNRDLAFEVNCRSAVNVALAAKQYGSRLLFLSTDYIFDGAKTTPYEPDDTRAPLSVYGRSKAEAEVQLSQVLPECCVLRTSWLFGTGGRCFPDTMLKLAASRPEIDVVQEIDVVNDQRGSPTYAVDLSRTIMRLCRCGATGIVHATNTGECSWFEFAREIVGRAGLNAVVRPTTSGRFVRPAERPKYSVLSPSSLHRLGLTMPAWQDALRRFLLERNPAP
jgi:dTDP-4-dehydrorhamnose reductase